jgi:hypothetical protein
VQGFKMNTTVRLSMLEELNLVALSFATPTEPQLNVHASLGPFGAGIGKLIKPTVSSVIKQHLTMPRRVMVPLYASGAGSSGRVVAGDMNVAVLDVKCAAFESAGLVLRAHLSKVRAAQLLLST